MKTRVVMAGVLLAAATLAGCSSTTGGTAVCPGCGTAAEPNFPTAPPRVVSPTETPEPGLTPTAPTPGATAAPSPGGTTLPSNDNGYVYVETKSGKTRCQLSSDSVGCESEFENSPEIDGEQANGVRVDTGGSLKWIVGNLGDIPTVTLDYGTYQAVGWTISAGEDGTRFTNNSTSHGMFVAVEGVQSF